MKKKIHNDYTAKIKEGSRKCGRRRAAGKNGDGERNEISVETGMRKEDTVQ